MQWAINSCPNLVLVVVTFARRISGKVKDKSVKLTKTGAESRKSAQIGKAGKDSSPREM